MTGTLYTAAAVLLLAIPAAAQHSITVSRCVDKDSGWELDCKTLKPLPFLRIDAPAAAQDAVFKDDVKQYVTRGEETDDIKVTVTLGPDGLTVRRNVKDETVIPYADIAEMTYDRRARQRKIWGLPTGGGYQPKLQHFLTIQFKKGAAGDFVELEMGKDIAARLVATLEAKSGKPVQKITG